MRRKDLEQSLFALCFELNIGEGVHMSVLLFPEHISASTRSKCCNRDSQLESTAYAATNLRTTENRPQKNQKMKNRLSRYSHSRCLAPHPSDSGITRALPHTHLENHSWEAQQLRPDLPRFTHLLACAYSCRTNHRSR